MGDAERMSLTREKLVTRLVEEFDVSPDDLDEETPLFSTGLLDSFSMVSLVTYIEQEEGFKLSVGEFALDNLDSVSRILRFVGRRRGG